MVVREEKPINGTEVAIGRYSILAGGEGMNRELLQNAQLLVSLQREQAWNWDDGKPYMVFPIPDFHAPEKEVWEAWLEGVILPTLAKGTRIAVHCTAGIGRTGMFVASLIALCEPAIDDPIAEARKRYRPDAVETLAQMELVFALCGRQLPEKYRRNDYYSNWRIGQ